MKIKAGDPINTIDLYTLGTSGIEAINLKDLTKNKRMVLFGIPGAYSAVCSQNHVPGYIQLKDDILKQGIDLIGCVAVNDPFTLLAFKQEHNIPDDIILLSDGNGTFTKTYGLDIDASSFSMGIRSTRYVMIINHTNIEYIAIEDSPLDLKVSSAEAMVTYLANQKAA